MKAAVFNGPRDIKVEEVPDPEVSPDGIIVKIQACGICGSDLHPYKQGTPPGLIYGHECSGDVVDVGANVSGVAEGERVLVSPVGVCWECHWCKERDFIRCANLQWPGSHVPGAFAEYTAIPTVVEDLNVLKIPDGMSYEVAATAEPMGVGLYAANRVQVQPEDCVVVIGTGMIGLCLIQALKAAGVSQIIASGRRSERLELAKNCGADIVVDAATDDVVAVVKEMHAERMADIAYDCAGSETTYWQSILSVHNGGTAVLVAIYEEPITWNPSAAVVRDVGVIGCIGSDMADSLELLATGKADTKPLISHEFALDDAKEAFETQLTAQDAVKVLIKP